VRVGLAVGAGVVRERMFNGQLLNGETKDEAVAVAIDKDKGSQYALKWAVDHILTRGQSVTLLHVKQKPAPNIPTPGSNVSIVFAFSVFCCAPIIAYQLFDDLP